MPDATEAGPSFGYLCVTEIAKAKQEKQQLGAVLTMKEVAVIIDRLDRSRNSLTGPDSVALTPAERVYATYPRKVGKKSALKAIARALADVPEKDLMHKTQAYADAVAKWPPGERQFVPHPATWFNRGSYLDDPKEWERGGTGRNDDSPRDYRNI